MTQEEKAKAYDEALKKARKLLNMILDNELLGFPDQIREIFPQLKESEDERIIKTIRQLLETARDAHSNTSLAKPFIDALAWIERQKEQQPAKQLGGTFTSYDMAKTFTEGQNYVIAHPEKFGLCKPAEWSEDYREEGIQTRFAFYTYKDDLGTLYLSNVFVEEASRNHGFGTRILIAAEKVAETIGATTISLKVKQDSPANAWYRKNGYGYVAFEDGYDWLEKNLEYMKPNKQEWDKFDEDYLKRTVWYIENPAPSVVKDTNLALWLKSLPVRFNLQLIKEGWSEDDEANLHRVIRVLEDNDSDWKELSDWLKALRPSWKPSKEQMEALRKLMKYAVSLSSYYDIQKEIESLYNDLNKLK